ncbi:hypothetical protein N7495_002753 [Penicillium taxi]|uniref:uncharacterized protein n=1 Tax=Penicillium taxi TaxID=168475 RepID=UPI0025455914|nr:uncharacterized protein N7495_002753 [Penicillium taxi]KAJ5902225.1 hypothetical protein N7495_002753 [Penicillium taxi]
MSRLYSSPSKRKVTPSFEMDQGTFKRKRRIYVTKKKIVDNTPLTHTHPLPQKQEEVEEAWHCKHIALPVDLQDLQIDLDRSDVKALLHSIFPATLNVAEARNRSNMIFQFEKLPSPPWPLTIGGIPVTLLGGDTFGRTFLFPKETLGNLKVAICSAHEIGTQISDCQLRILAQEVQCYFQNHLPGVELVEILFSNAYSFYVVLDDGIKIPDILIKLPGKITNRPVYYLNDQDLHRPMWADLPAKRHMMLQPALGIPDDTPYDIIRPGIMICSKLFKEHAHPAFFSTTSGVFVQNAAGETFMTGASHGIGESNNVFQPKNPDIAVGYAAINIPHTDIILVRLKKGLLFDLETFEEEGGTTPKFTRLANSSDNKNLLFTNLNSPFTGRMDGVVIGKSVKIKGSGTAYIVYDWSYSGQVEDNSTVQAPADGVCGSAIWDDNGIVLGFYHYYIKEGRWAGFSASVSASELTEVGYTLAQPGGKLLEALELGQK